MVVRIRTLIPLLPGSLVIGRTPNLELFGPTRIRVKVRVEGDMKNS
jgi:hypothetical protein